MIFSTLHRFGGDACNYISFILRPYSMLSNDESRSITTGLCPEAGRTQLKSQFELVSKKLRIRKQSTHRSVTFPLKNAVLECIYTRSSADGFCVPCSRSYRAFGWHLQNFLVVRCFTRFLAFEHTFYIQRVPGEFRFLEEKKKTRLRNKTRLICIFCLRPNSYFCTFFLKNIYGFVCQDTIKEYNNMFNKGTTISFQGRDSLLTEPNLMFSI